MKRLFLALNLPGNIKSVIAEFAYELKKKYQGVNWVSHENYHITLQFLGNCDQEQQARAENIMDKLEGKFGEFIFGLGEISAFPDLKNPRVLFLECRQINNRKVLGLYKTLQFELANSGFEMENRLWTPHVTIGRVKARISLQAGLKINYIEVFKIKTLELMESILKSVGPEYKIIRGVNL